MYILIPSFIIICSPHCNSLGVATAKGLPTHLVPSKLAIIAVAEA